MKSSGPTVSGMNITYKPDSLQYNLFATYKWKNNSEFRHPESIENIVLKTVTGIFPQDIMLGTIPPLYE